MARRELNAHKIATNQIQLNWIGAKTHIYPFVDSLIQFNLIWFALLDSIGYNFISQFGKWISRPVNRIDWPAVYQPHHSNSRRSGHSGGITLVNFSCAWLSLTRAVCCKQVARRLAIKRRPSFCTPMTLGIRPQLMQATIALTTTWSKNNSSGEAKNQTLSGHKSQIKTNHLKTNKPTN